MLWIRSVNARFRNTGERCSVSPANSHSTNFSIFINHTNIDAYNLDTDNVLRKNELKKEISVITFVNKDLRARKKLIPNLDTICITYHFRCVSNFETKQHAFLLLSFLSTVMLDNNILLANKHVL
jgi:hypothetical protein